MDYKQIKELIKLVGSSQLSELKVEDGDFKITLRTKDYGNGKTQVVSVPAAAAAPVPVAAPQAAAEPTPEAEEQATEDTSGAIEAKSPMVGTFYRASGPDKEPFVKVGDIIEVGTVICIVEAMKLFNEIESEVAGKVIKVLTDDASPVQYDQPLFLVEPQ